MWATETSGIRTFMIDPTEPVASDFPAWTPEEALDELAVRPGGALLVDLTGVRQARSDFFGYLARLKSLLGGQGSRLVVLVTHDDLRRSFQILGLDRVFKLCSELDEAVSLCKLERKGGA